MTNQPWTITPKGEWVLGRAHQIYPLGMKGDRVQAAAAFRQALAEWDKQTPTVATLGKSND